MAISERALGDQILTILRGMAYFDDQDVARNDWSLLDKQTVTAPLAVLQTAEDFTALADSAVDRLFFTLPVFLFIDFQDWKTSLDEFMDVRQSILDTFYTGGNRSLNLDGVYLERISALSAVDPYFDPMLPEELVADADPLYLVQAIGFEVQQY